MCIYIYATNDISHGVCFAPWSNINANHIITKDTCEIHRIWKVKCKKNVCIYITFNGRWGACAFALKLLYWEQVLDAPHVNPRRPVQRVLAPPFLNFCCCWAHGFNYLVCESLFYARVLRKATVSCRANLFIIIIIFKSETPRPFMNANPENTECAGPINWLYSEIYGGWESKVLRICYRHYNDNTLWSILNRFALVSDTYSHHEFKDPTFFHPIASLSIDSGHFTPTFDLFLFSSEKCIYNLKIKLFI